VRVSPLISSATAPIARGHFAAQCVLSNEVRKARPRPWPVWRIFRGAFHSPRRRNGPGPAPPVRLTAANLLSAGKKYTRFPPKPAGTSSAAVAVAGHGRRVGLGCWKTGRKCIGGGSGRGDRVYFAFSFGPFIGFCWPSEAAQQLQCLCIPGGGQGSAGGCGHL